MSINFEESILWGGARVQTAHRPEKEPVSRILRGAYIVSDISEPQRVRIKS